MLLSKTIRFLLFIVFFCINFTLLGQVKKDSVRKLNEVIVMSLRNPKQLQSATPLQTLNRQRLSEINAFQISDAIKFFSGVTIKDYGGIGGLKTLSVRGLGANHTAINYDGVTITDIQTGQIDLGKFSLTNVDMISLINGQSDNIFQPARLFASGTVLNINTIKPYFEKEKTINGNVFIKLGAWQFINPTVSIQKKINEKLSLAFDSEYLSTDGKYPYILHYRFERKDSTSNEIRQNTDVKKIKLETTLFAHFTKNETARIKLYYYNSKSGLPGATIFYNTNHFSSQRVWENTFFSQISYQKKLSQKWSLLTNAKYNRAYLRYLDPAFLNQKGKLDNQYTQQEYYISGATHYRALKNWTFSFANDISWTELKMLQTSFSYPNRWVNLSVLSTKFTAKRWVATANILSTLVYENIKKEKATQKYNQLSPAVSFSIQPFKNVNLRLRTFYKNIFRMPTFNDLYYSKIGNLNLVPEKINQLNAGITFQTHYCKAIPHFSFSIDGYHNIVKDKIVAYPTKNIFVWTMLNYGQVSINGVDMAIKGIIEPAPHYHIVLNSNYSYQRALNTTDKNSREYLHQIPYIPRISGSNRIAIKTPYFNLSYSMLWSGKRYTLQQNYAENRLSGYTEHNFMLSTKYLIGKNRMKINFELLNAFNNNYSIVRYFPMPLRSWRATIGYQF